MTANLVTTRTVPFAQCTITADAVARANEVMASGWMTAGARTVAFERALGEWLGAAQVVAVSSCTAAIELALRALNLRPGSPVLTPTLTFCGAVHAIVHSGLRPVFVDVDEQTLGVSCTGVAAAAHRERPAAMVVQHMAGYPLDVAALADAAGLPLARIVEDAAHGLGASVGTSPVGTISQASCFSFYATKNLPIGEGGAITTADGGYADLLRASRQHGMSRDAWARYLPGGSWRYSVEVDGLKANFTDLQAAIGLGQLGHLASWQRRRRELAERYDSRLRGVPGIVLPPRPVAGEHAWHLYIVRVHPEYGRSRDDLATQLTSVGIGTSVHFMPVHQFSYFRRLLDLDPGGLPIADRVADQLLSLPLHPALSEDDVDEVAARIAEFYRGGEKADATG
jgi:dTDP-4-amino-4,6-dideoxygalactose transaminase